MADPSTRRQAVPFGLAVNKPRTGLIDTRVDPKLMANDPEKFCQNLTDILTRLDSTLNKTQDQVLELNAQGRASTCIILPDVVIEFRKEAEFMAPMVTPFPINITTPVPVAGVILIGIIDIFTAGNPGQFGTTLNPYSAHIVPVPGMVGMVPSSLPGGQPQESQQWQCTFINGLTVSRRYLLRFAGIRFATPPNPINGRVNLVTNGSSGV